VKPEDSHSTEAAEGSAALDGLTGRGGDSQAAREGARLREALLPRAEEVRSVEQPSWQSIVARARQPVAPARDFQKPVAANHWRWYQAAGGVALLAVLATTALWISHAPDETTSATMRGASTPSPATWRTEHPVDAARDLARQLESAGARVKLTTTSNGAMLEITCEVTGCQRINELLARLETSVDSQGRVTVQVLPP
jgi:hypothetical protein